MFDLRSGGQYLADSLPNYAECPQPRRVPSSCAVERLWIASFSGTQRAGPELDLPLWSLRTGCILREPEVIMRKTTTHLAEMWEHSDDVSFLNRES